MISVIQSELTKQYRRERGRLRDYLAALEVILADDFPSEQDAEKATRYHVDALRGIISQISALIEGYEKR